MAKKRKDFYNRIFAAILILFVCTMSSTLLYRYLCVFNKVAVSNSYTFDEWYSTRQILYKEYKQVGPANRTYDTLRADINELTNFDFYFLFYSENLDEDGRALAPFYIIQMKPDLTLANYTYTLTHEIMHHKLLCANEAYVSFSTFKALYESGDPFFKQVAIEEALDTMYKHPYHEYNYTGELIKYFSEHS